MEKKREKLEKGIMSEVGKIINHKLDIQTFFNATTTNDNNNYVIYNKFKQKKNKTKLMYKYTYENMVMVITVKNRNKIIKKLIYIKKLFTL